MPAVARKNGTDSIATNHGCSATTATDTGSSDVFSNNIGVVRRGDLTAVHTVPVGDSCPPHQVPLTSFSPTVFANNKNIGRVGDQYSGHTITSGSPTVFANG
jgi:uncharacterized Zn-binding protein involved in type VI secretion